MEISLLQSIAQKYGPRYAWGLAGADLVSYHGGIELQPTDINQPRGVTMQQVPDFSYILEATYDVELPNYAPGSIWRGQQIEYNARHPSIDMMLAISQGLGPSNQLLTANYQEVQHLLRNTSLPEGAGGGWLRNKVMWAWQMFQMQVMLRRTLSTGEAPYKLSVAIKAYVPPYPLAPISVNEAVCGLEGLGVQLTEDQKKIDALRPRSR